MPPNRTQKQEAMHQIAEIARSVGLEETDPIITRAQQIWYEEEERIYQEIYYNISQEDIDALARTMWGEARGITDKAEIAAVAWCVLNRVDAGYGTILKVVSAPGQFDGYKSYFPVTEELAELAKDVLIRWNREKAGETEVGRVLPLDYLFFHGDGYHNWFRKQYNIYIYWDWSLPNPYK